jgi:hypothetical protein
MHRIYPELLAPDSPVATDIRLREEPEDEEDEENDEQKRDTDEEDDDPDEGYSE